MFELTRTIRLPLSAVQASPEIGRDGAGNTGYSLAGPSALGLAPVVSFDVTCRGEPAESGYLIDITKIDAAARAILEPRLRDRVRAEVSTGKPTDLPRFLRAIAAELAPKLPARLVSLEYRPSPHRAVRWFDSTAATASDSATTPPMRTTPSDILLLSTFEFAASHRLQLPGKTDEQNAALFGKCANVHGHGHNYRIEVAVTQTDTSDASPAFPRIDAAVKREIMGRFDHKNLNVDCPEFAALNPSVEHIAMICHQVLAPAFAGSDLCLSYVRVWETEKTSCRYPA